MNDKSWPIWEGFPFQRVERKHFSFYASHNRKRTIEFRTIADDFPLSNYVNARFCILTGAIVPYFRPRRSHVSSASAPALIGSAPYFVVRDLAASLDYYCDVLGFQPAPAVGRAADIRNARPRRLHLYAQAGEK